jgi:hypothetical protein
MGPVAEDAAIAVLKNNSNDFWVRGDIAGVLGQIGGEDSIKVLEEIASRLSDFDSGSLRQAINTIQRRLTMSPGKPARAAKKPKKTDEKRASEEPARAAEPAMRTWHDDSGKFEVEAAFVSLDDETVTLKKKNGRTIHVPLGRLSEEDQKYVKERANNPFDEESSDK